MIDLYNPRTCKQESSTAQKKTLRPTLLRIHKFRKKKVIHLVTSVQGVNDDAQLDVTNNLLSRPQMEEND